MREHALAEQRPVRGAVLVDATTSRDGDISASVIRLPRTTDVVRAADEETVGDERGKR
jgi:hypothetical protein